MLKDGKLGDNVVVYVISGGNIEFFDVNHVYVEEIEEDIFITLVSSGLCFGIPKDKVKKWYRE